MPAQPPYALLLTSMSSPLSRHELPGFGLPLNFTPHGESTTYSYDYKLGNSIPTVHPALGEWGALYPNAIADQLRLITLREFTMMRFMNQLTDKPAWDTKIFCEATIAKWKAEALATTDIDMTERMFTYCIDELRHKSGMFQETGIITAYDGDVVKSDVAISSFLKGILRIAMAPLEDVPEVYRDWHPNSNEMVLDLVHPSLFPVVYGRTRILSTTIVGLDDCVKKCGEGETLSVPSCEETQLGGNIGRYDSVMQDPYSCKFQWLPCEVEFDGDKAKITSYINNLHPQMNKPLYEVIEHIINLTIPLWNHVLTPLHHWQSLPRIIYSECEYDPNPMYIPKEERPQQLPNQSDEDYWERLDQWERDTRRVVKPEPREFEAPQEDTKNVDLKTEFARRGIQVIVKLANIHLTPEKPEYGGGTWHVEGQLNEHICATALYYYDNSNITESALSFRQLSSTEEASDVSYQQEHHEWLSEVFGCEQDGPAVQYIGDVVTKEGRLLAFPNVFQHRVGPFGLIDKTKQGHRKILALFLVDPHIRVISSANVPCQQKEWWAQELQANGVFSTLPDEMVKEVVDNVDEFPIGLDEAKGLRVELMEERKKFVQRHDLHFESTTFSLCEH